MKEKIWKKVKESFSTALIAAFMLVMIFFLVWIPIKIIPNIFSKSSKYVATTLSSTFISNSNKATSTATTTVTNIQKPVVVTQTYTNGKPDFAITLLSIGVINKYTKQFTQTSIIGNGDEVGIRFEVKNIGNGISGNWNFKANLPSMTTPLYNSDKQISLNPGDKIQFTMGFYNPVNIGLNNVYIYVDPANTINESYESNNSLNIPINIINGSTYNNGTNLGATYTWSSLSGACSVLPATAYTGAVVNWDASASGGNGYFTYSWNGTDNFYSTGKNPTKIYYTAGTKISTVVITSNGSSITKQCSVNIVDQLNNSNYNNSDLSLALIGVGTIDYNGQFSQNSQVSKGGNIAIKVRVNNLGSTYSGTWSITGSVSPSLPGYTYRQDNQQSLAPGAIAEYTMVFWNPQVVGDNTFNIQINQSNTDTNNTNNNLTANIRIY